MSRTNEVVLAKQPSRTSGENNEKLSRSSRTSETQENELASKPSQVNRTNQKKTARRSSQIRKTSLAEKFKNFFQIINNEQDRDRSHANGMNKKSESRKVSRTRTSNALVSCCFYEHKMQVKTKNRSLVPRKEKEREKVYFS